MKKSLFLVLAMLSFWGCTPEGKTVSVFNSCAKSRTRELVEVSARQLSFDTTQLGCYALTDAEGNPVPYQVMYYGQPEPQSIVFQADVQGGSTAVYHWKKGTPVTAEAKVYARYIPERKDDFAWENQTAAYRMYGPALADENPSNGVDLWLKCTDELVVDSFYYREHQLGYSYHINWGKGLDCYKVAHTLGCGGVAPFVNDSLCVLDHYNTWEIIDQGPLRVRFRLTYDDMALTVTADAGNPFNRAEVIYTGKEDNLELAAGIYLHDNKGISNYDIEAGWIAYAEDAVSDAGVPQGRNYVAVIMPSAYMHQMDKEHHLLIAPYNKGEVLTYWFAGGWSQWQYPTDDSWFALAAASSNFLTHPLQVTVR